MNVLLPDGSKLELPDGATGLDAARAIGPKLAEQAVLLRSNGQVKDLRLPLEDGEQIQILTTRDKDDPDALAVLRHSSAHLLAEAVRRLYPGVKIAIGPPIENGFYYDFEFPEPIHEADLGRIEEEIRHELKEGRAWSREEIGADQAKARFEDEPYKVELVDTAEGQISLYTQGDFTDLCRGPHLQDSKPIKALKLTSLAGAYWRGDVNNKQLTRIYGTAFYDQKDLDAYLERVERARERDHRRLGPQLDLMHWTEYAPAAALWHPKGMALYNALDDMRRRENARRGYLEVKTPLMWDIELWKRSGHWDKYREHIFLIPYGDEQLYGLKPMNCPGHMLLFASRQRSYKDLPLRYRGTDRAPSRRARRRVARSPSRAPVPAGRRARLLHAGADRGGDRRDVRLPRLPLRQIRRARDRKRGACDSARQQARHRRGLGLHRGRAAERDRSHGPRATRSPRARARSTGRRSTSSSTTRWGVRGRWGRSSSTASSRRGWTASTSARTTPSTCRGSSTARSSARSSASSAS